MWNGVLGVLGVVAFLGAALSEKNGSNGGGYATAGAVMLSTAVAVHYWRHTTPTRDGR